RKDCLGSSTSQSSRVWFTVAGGVLSDVYSPTTDNSNLSTLQYVVSDGHSFADLQTRDMTYTVRPRDATGMSCQVIASARSSSSQRNYEVPVYGALVGDRPYSGSSSGFVGQPSDGLVQLDTRQALGPTYRDAAGGNVEQTAEIDISHSSSFTLALGYGQTL